MRLHTLCLLSISLAVFGAMFLAARPLVFLWADSTARSVFWQDTAAPYCLTVLVLVFLLVPMLLALGSRNFVEDATSKGELERLLQIKSQGNLLQRSQRIRESAKRTLISAGAVSADSGPPAFDEGELERLLQEKRRGAWIPPA
jgi:hypothetical protein